MASLQCLKAGQRREDCADGAPDLSGTHMLPEHVVTCGAHVNRTGGIPLTELVPASSSTIRQWGIIAEKGLCSPRALLTHLDT